jgi:uncharacterized protein YabE (DUF348 family)
MVSLYVDGQKKLFPTDAATVGDVLRRSNVKLASGDLVEPSAGTSLTHGQFNINVYRSRPVLVIDGAKSYHIRSAYQSPRLLALAAGLSVFAEDEYHSAVVTDIVGSDTIGEQVTIKRAKPITVNVDGHTQTIRTQAKVLGAALSAADIAVAPKDTVSVPEATPVIPGMTVTITRVTEAVVTQTQVIARATKTITDPTMLKGQTQVKTEGSDGQKTITYRVHYQNGVETSRETLQLVSQTDPVTKVIVVGTKVIFAGSVEYWRPMVEAAAAQYGIDPNMMMRVMACESKGNASAVNSTPVGRSGEHATGLFQYLPSTWRSAGGTDDNIFDGALQIQVAARNMAVNGTNAWSCK